MPVSEDGNNKDREDHAIHKPEGLTSCNTKTASIWQQHWVDLSLLRRTFITLIRSPTVMIDMSSLDGIDRSNKYPSLLVNAGVDGPFVAFVLTIRTDHL